MQNMSKGTGNADDIGVAMLMAIAGLILGLTNSIKAIPVALVLMALATFVLGRTRGLKFETGVIAGGLSLLCGGGGILVGSLVRGL